jgi:hypothetical protein
MRIRLPWHSLRMVFVALWRTINVILRLPDAGRLKRWIYECGFNVMRMSLEDWSLAE